MNNFHKDLHLDRFMDILYGKFSAYFEHQTQDILVRNFKMVGELPNPYARIYYGGISYPIFPISHAGDLVYMDLHPDLHLEMQAILDERTDLIAERIIVRNYFRRLLNAAYCPKDVKALLPESIQSQLYTWGKNTELAHMSMSEEHVLAFKKKEQKHSAILAERFLTNILVFS